MLEEKVDRLRLIKRDGFVADDELHHGLLHSTENGESGRTQKIKPHQ